MSEKKSTAPVTPVAPARVPDGWWWRHPRYRNYVLFAATGLVLAIGAATVVRAVQVLAQGAQAWDSYLANLGGVAAVINGLLVVAMLFFAVRFLRVGTKVNAVPIGPLPAFPEPVWLVLQGAGLVTGWALVLLILWGVIL
jgi:fumarate reductase subunit C